MRVKPDISTRTIQNLLGALYKDREFLEEVLHYEDNKNHSRKTSNSDKIRELAVAGLNFLDSRLEFWQQQQPMRPSKGSEALRNKLRKSQAALKISDHKRSQIILGILADLDKIDDCQTKNQHEEALKLCESLKRHVEKWGEKVVPNQSEVMANIYALEGNSYLELGQLDQALLCHQADLCIATELNLPEAKSRAQDNIGRTYAKQKKYAKAIEIWEERLPTIKTDLESTWLNHELGRCYLELDDTDKAVHYGNLSLAKAEVLQDKTWKLNANVLVAQAQLKKEDFAEALESFLAAEKFADELNNRAASRAINKAIEGVKMKLDLGIDNIGIVGLKRTPHSTRMI